MFNKKHEKRDLSGKVATVETWQKNITKEIFAIIAKAQKMNTKLTLQLLT